MDRKEALKILADMIWKQGESEFTGQQCLVPMDFWESGYTITSYLEAIDYLIRDIGATHFDRKWKERGKQVELNFYCVDFFGAALVNEEDIVITEIVGV